MLMSKPEGSSNVTAGDGISFAAETIKLLAPVLKVANRKQIEGLKRNAGAVQELFRRMLAGEPVVHDYGDSTNPVFVKFRNETRGDTRVQLDPNVRFTIAARPVRADSGQCFELRVLAYNVRENKPVKGKVCKFETLALGLTTDGFVSVQSLCVNDPGSIRGIVQGKQYAERATLTLHDGSGHDPDLHYDLEIVVRDGERALFHDSVKVGPEDLRAIGFKFAR